MSGRYTDAAVRRFFREIRGKRVALLGIGISNSGLAALFREHGAQVSAHDKRTREQLGEAAGELERQGAVLRLGEGYLDGLEREADIVFRTPGMQYHMPELVRLRRAGVILTSEMEVFLKLCPCPVVAVTGSDGKTTTTTLIAEMLKATGRTVHLGGNLGRALLPEIFRIGEEDAAVVELSSFQLISMRSSPGVAVVTNVSPNHLDVHRDMDEYTGAKQNIFLHQDAFARTVLNLDDPITASFADEVRGRVSWFSLEQPVEQGAYLEDGWLIRAEKGRTERLLPASEIRIPGRHNIANYLAATAAAGDLAGADQIRKVAREFGGVEHRIELVRELDGVRWYNDSIATSPTRAIAGLLSFDRRIILIAGGYDKKIPFDPLVPHLIERVKLLILTGDTADQIEAALREHPDYTGTPRVLRAKDLEDAVGLAREQAESGDVVSLSPACASFDRYPNFEARGRHFKELVGALRDV